MIGKEQPIGFFDSGIGGLSVLLEAVRQLPSESYLYLGDSLNAPYGVKTVEEVQALSLKAVSTLVDQGAKAVVVACNTATSASIQLLRKTFDIPIIGMEPALKLAVDEHQRGSIVVLATAMTLKEKKFSDLMIRVGLKQSVLTIPAPELVLAVENQQVDDAALWPIFESYFAPYREQKLDAVVLGCTHYVFLKAQLSRFLGPKVRLIDGNAGTVRHLRSVLSEAGLLNTATSAGTVTITMTGGQKSLDAALAVFQEGKQAEAHHG